MNRTELYASILKKFFGGFGMGYSTHAHGDKDVWFFLVVWLISLDAVMSDVNLARVLVALLGYNLGRRMAITPTQSKDGGKESPGDRRGNGEGHGRTDQKDLEEEGKGCSL